jgi:hypothetical protein
LVRGVVSLSARSYPTATSITVHPRSSRVSLEYGELVTQDEDLDLLGGVGPEE